MGYSSSANAHGTTARKGTEKMDNTARYVKSLQDMIEASQEKQVRLVEDIMRNLEALKIAHRKEQDYWRKLIELAEQDNQ
jgi:hypothetical protein